MRLPMCSAACVIRMHILHTYTRKDTWHLDQLQFLEVGQAARGEHICCSCIYVCVGGQEPHWAWIGPQGAAKTHKRKGKETWFITREVAAVLARVHVLDAERLQSVVGLRCAVCSVACVNVGGWGSTRDEPIHSYMYTHVDKSNAPARARGGSGWGT